MEGRCASSRRLPIRFCHGDKRRMEKGISAQVHGVGNNKIGRAQACCKSAMEKTMIYMDMGSAGTHSCAHVRSERMSTSKRGKSLLGAEEMASRARMRECVRCQQPATEDCCFRQSEPLPSSFASFTPTPRNTVNADRKAYVCKLGPAAASPAASTGLLRPLHLMRFQRTGMRYQVSS